MRTLADQFKDSEMTQSLFADLDLARRLERAEAHANARFVEARARITPNIHAEWIEVAGAYAMFDGIDSPLTQSFGLGLFDKITPEHLEELACFFHDRGSTVYHEISPLALMRPPLLELLNVGGYRPLELSSVMYLGLPTAAARASCNERIRVRQIAETERDIWVRVTLEGWSEYPELKEYLRGIGPVMAAREDGVLFLAEIAGQPIAAAALSIHDGVALLAGAATIPPARRQGAQQALLAKRLHFSHQQGCDVAMMCAQPGSASQRNAERQGFRIAYTRIKWESNFVHH